MNSSQSVMKYGSIYKREALVSIPSSDKINHLVLKSDDPFPGFYCPGKNPADNSCKTEFYYLPVHKMPYCHEDIICRISLEIVKEKAVQVCGSHIMFGGKFVQAIRIKGADMALIEEIVDVFENNDIQFYKEKPVNTYLSEIYLKAFITVEEIEESVFQNTISPEIYYFQIPDKLEWATFEKLITYQKSNSSFKNFDAALGYWIQKPLFIDFVRVYSNKLSLNQLLNIKKDFLDTLAAYRDKKILI
ncbi:MAG: hypothetical protein ABFS05_04980 [Bacteroidota bacterium]